MARPPHRVRRLRLRVRACSQAEAFALRQRIRADWEESLLPTLSEVFDEVSPGDEVVRIAKLEVTLKVRSLDELPERLPTALRLELPNRPAASSGTPSGASPPPSSVTASSAGPTPAPAGPMADLLAYLETGSLPWTLAGADQAALRVWLDAITPEALARAVVTAAGGTGRWSARVAVFFRAFQLVPEERHAGFVRAIVAARPGEHDEAFVAGVVALASDCASWARHDRLRLAAVMAALREGARPLREVLAPVMRPPSVSGTGQADSYWNLVDVESLWAAPPPGVPLLPRSSPGSAADMPDGHAADARAPREEGAPAAFGLTVECAGLVLLHPYLQRFFKSAGVLGGGERTPPEAALPRAGALLLLLATGQDEALEFELGFIKVLLGLQPESPLPIAQGLTTGVDREEADGLLRALIEHWGALKNTSPEGLRGSFLRRRGLLYEDARGWRLHVESAGYDVLLGRLPWAVGVVKLPWMRKALFTEWTHP